MMFRAHDDEPRSLRREESSSMADRADLKGDEESKDRGRNHKSEREWE